MKTLHIRIGLVSLLAVLFGSCSQQWTDQPSPDGDIGDEIVFRTQIAPTTRTTTIGRKTVFAADDQMGVFGLLRSSSAVLRKNLGYTYKESQWTSETPITFPVDGSAMNFYAYYPLVAGAETTTFDFTVSKDQATEGYEPSDLLLAKNEEAKVTDLIVAFSFTHALALVEVSATLPAGVTCRTALLKARRTATVNLLTASAIVKTSDTESSIALEKQTDGTFRGVVPVQELKGQCITIIGDDGISYRYTANDAVPLQANKINTFSFTY